MLRFLLTFSFMLTPFLYLVVIPEIARSFGVLQTPARWPGEVFDRTWVISFQIKGKPVFQNLPQRLMFGDSLN